MGYASLLAICYLCGQRFSCNPVRVPSFRDRHGIKQGVCKSCIETLNSQRVRLGMEPFDILADAYEACNENELT